LNLEDSAEPHVQITLKTTSGTARAAIAGTRDWSVLLAKLAIGGLTGPVQMELAEAATIINFRRSAEVFWWAGKQVRPMRNSAAPGESGLVFFTESEGIGWLPAVFLAEL
jgi:hypothetical protein